MDIIEIDRNRLQDIRDLWKELNSLHRQLSSNFKQHFDSFTFEKRVEKLICKEYLSIFVASDADLYVGYCIATADKNRGEIDSIYVQPSYRGQKVGHELMIMAMEWLNKQDCNEIDIYVAEGNEQVLGFYEKYGFKKRSTVMQKKRA